MHVLRSAGTLVLAATLCAGLAACAQSIEGSGTIAEGVLTGSPSPTASGSPTDPTDSASPTTTPSPTSSPSPSPTSPTVRRRVLCVLEQAAIATTNRQVNAARDRNAQLRVLRTASTTISGHLTRSGLPGDDRIRLAGGAVVTELNALVKGATAGGSPSTKPYNDASLRFARVCGTI
jgi:hypothetical protein